MMNNPRLNRPPRRRRRRQVTPTGRLLLVGILLIMLAGIVFIRQINFWLGPVDPQAAAQVVVNIPSQSTTVKIAQQLYEKGLIKNETFFYLYTRYEDVDQKLQAGEYAFSPQMSVPQIVAKLVHGDVIRYSFTIPEGYTIQQIADLLAANGFFEKDKFLAATREKYEFDFLAEVPAGDKQLEGFLFPATYQIDKGTDERETVRLMLKRFGQVATPEMRAKAKDRGLTILEWITMASLIEKEAQVDEERPIIAGVLFNRLRLGMPLQVDATVLYALGGHKEKVYYKDLEVNSPYNTYKHTGLPPGPIASPGEESLKAVLYPASHNYFYYVARNDGTHDFTATLTEHNAAIKRNGQ